MELNEKIFINSHIQILFNTVEDMVESITKINFRCQWDMSKHGNLIKLDIFFSGPIDEYLLISEEIYSNSIEHTIINYKELKWNYSHAHFVDQMI